MPEDEYSPMTPSQVRQLRDELDSQGKKLVFTNGCFDLLHAGHVRYLNEARALGDAMVVALNSDESVRELKGPSRPINPEHDRAEVMAALRAVDAVVVFGDKRATGLIETIRPHIYAKGGDYTVESLNAEERAALDEAGASIRILPLVPGRSTTKTIQRMNTDGAGDRLRIGVLGSGEGSNFRAILAAIAAGSLQADVCVAISDQADSRFLKTAREAGIPAIHVDGGPNPRRYNDAAQKEIAEHLQRAQVDVVVLIGFMRILKEPTLSLYADRIVNVHPSLLPKYKGANAPQMAIEAGDTETGCTVHLVTAEIDAGRILAKAAVPVLPGDTPETLHGRIKEQEHKLLPGVLAQWKK
ncbi:formyltetrahydrofolate-dependent phosphoribosylglycinamide formyltransferase [Prosthecobacter fusiformis]|uniref:Phosphoribosylglycinamide formyltransferase n=1 Tax=Prosthecobacter fusiformis TaxID=48464 RepID=A0A4R7S7V1_9BACT|nr:phosphoribosylglycinamide formyltransferase [Prosthecobacter fusiformis]TDU73317.1 formyltetrahydrofolate-dependent phosphoribosylglycinamide formyltransferase [Prosthecobacter fusiformis]